MWGDDLSCWCFKLVYKYNIFDVKKTLRESVSQTYVILLSWIGEDAAPLLHWGSSSTAAIWSPEKNNGKAAAEVSTNTQDTALFIDFMIW